MNTVPVAYPGAYEFAPSDTPAATPLSLDRTLRIEQKDFDANDISAPLPGKPSLGFLARLRLFFWRRKQSKAYLEFVAEIPCTCAYYTIVDGIGHVRGSCARHHVQKP